MIPVDELPTYTAREAVQFATNYLVAVVRGERPVDRDSLLAASALLRTPNFDGVANWGNK